MTAPTIDSEGEIVLREVAYAPPRRPPSAAMPGTRWSESGRYIIDRLLGRGGMGTVYAATDTLLGRVVALKVLDAADADEDAARHAHLLREAQLAARVEHERIARVYDVGRHEGFAFVAMEYVQGGTLRQWMTEHHATLAQVVDIATQIAEGLAALHARRVVHRDLKPENVMLTAQGGIKLLDFGLARHTVIPDDEPFTPNGTGIAVGPSVAAAAGTPGYMAPEQCAGQPLDERVDIFALGVILYELIAGERPFRGATARAIMKATLDETPVLRDGAWADIPERLRDDIARMLARDPDARFCDGGSVLFALREITVQAPAHVPLPAATAEVMGQATTQVAPPLRPSRRNRRWLAGALEVSVVVGTTALIVSSPAAHHRIAATPPPGMIRIDVGTIDVGRDPAEIERDCHAIGAGCDRKQLLREVPRIRVSIAPFFLDRDEVTNEAFAEMLNTFTGTLVVLDDEEHHYPRFVRRNAGTDGDGEVLFDLNGTHGGIEYVDRREFRVRPGHERLPAAQVSWYGAKLFCESRGKRLPTDDEWEAAARGRQDRRYPWGDAPPRCGDVVVPNDGEIAMPKTCSAMAAARAVGTATQDVSPDGVRDLAGNVAEWTSSRFVEGDRAANPATGPRDAPRVIRGGSWGESLMARASGRNRRPPSIMGANLGFRCASSEDAE